MKLRDYIYIICMFFFIVLAYLFFDRGFNLKTKEFIKYQENSDLNYRVFLHENDEYQEEYLKMGGRYITSLVDSIKVDFKYNSLFNRNMYGFYNYQVVGTLHAYLDSINESIWEKDYILLDNKTKVINENNIKDIDILDRFTIDYDKYKKELDDFSLKYGIDLSGYLEVNININENLNFKGVEDITEDKKNIKMIIPLSYDTFKINIENDNNKIDSYGNFNNRNKVNYLFVILGAFSLSLGISFMALVIREMVKSTDKVTRYNRELKKILTEHEEKIVKVKRFYNKKEYNLIYVESFKELLDVYDKVNNPISYREIKKNEDAMFIIVDDDNAWIYQMKCGK